AGRRGAALSLPRHHLEAGQEAEDALTPVAKCNAPRILPRASAAGWECSQHFNACSPHSGPAPSGTLRALHQPSGRLCIAYRMSVIGASFRATGAGPSCFGLVAFSNAKPWALLLKTLWARHL